MDLTQGQKWIAAAFIVSVLTVANSLFVQGDIQTFLYVAIGASFAFFAIIMGDRNKSKRQE